MHFKKAVSGRVDHNAAHRIYASTPTTQLALSSLGAVFPVMPLPGATIGGGILSPRSFLDWLHASEVIHGPLEEETVKNTAK
jgi:hypothetical protein